MEYSLAKHSRKENLTKVDIPIIVKPVIDVAHTISPTSKTLKNLNFGEMLTIVALAKKNKIMSLLEAYDQPVRVPISVASSLTRSRVCCHTSNSKGNSHTA